MAEKIVIRTPGPKIIVRDTRVRVLSAAQQGLRGLSGADLALDNTNPADLGAVNPGVSTKAAHRDHVHTRPVYKSAPVARYCDPAGDDSFSGLSWDSPKQTILSAYDSLPNAGGTVYVGDNSFVGGEVIHQGIWIIGPDDPLYATPPLGWRSGKGRVRFIGEGSGISPVPIPFARPGTASVLGGSPNDVDAGWTRDQMKPAIWISGWSECMSFANLTLAYVHVGIRLGVGTDNVNRSRGVALIDFDNVNILTPPDAFDGGCGPAVDAGYAYWINFRRCSIMAYHGAPLEDDRRAAILLKANGSAPGTWLIEDCRFGGGGGVKYDPSGATSGWGAITVSDVLVESNWFDASAPASWLSNFKSLGFGMFLKNLSIADDGPGTPASVKVAAGIDPTVVVAINAGRVSGPATLIGSSYPADGLSMGAHHQVGIGAGGSSGANRFAGALSTTRFPVKPLVAQSFYLTRGYPPTSANTVTVSETDGPVGLTAYRLTSSLAPFNRDVLNVAAIDSAATVAVGDMYVMGCWVRAPDGIDLSHPDAPVLYFGFNGADAVLDGANYYVVKAPTSDGSWSWVSVATKVTAITNNPPGPMRLLALMYPNFRLDIFQPTVYRFATGTYDESDILDWIQSIVPMPASATAGNAVLLPGQNLEFGKNQSAVGPQITYASAIPTSGTWAAGSLAFHSAPIFLQPRGWVCTASGTPGQWSGMEPLPLPIPTTGLKLWLRADLGVTLSDGFVSQWSDFSGNSNDVANATGGQQPTVTASSINGLPAITWPGNSTVFLHNTVTNLVSSNAARTVIAIIKPGANSYAWLFTFRRAAPVFAIGWNNAFGFHWVYRDNQGANYEIVPNGPTPGTAYMLEFGYDGLGGDITFTHNTTTEIVTDGGAGVLSDTGTTGFTVGANETAAGSTTFSGDVAEIIAYDHVITAAERLALRIYVQARYGIPLGV